MRTCVLPYCWCIWNSIHTLGAHACLILSLCLLSQPLFARVGRASARFIASLNCSLFMSLLTHRLVLLCVDAYCLVFWDLPGDVLAAPESAMCGWIGVILLSLSLSRAWRGGVCACVWAGGRVHVCVCVSVSVRACSAVPWVRVCGGWAR